MPAARLALAEMGHTDSAGTDEETPLNVTDILSWMLEIDM